MDAQPTRRTAGASGAPKSAAPRNILAMSRSDWRAILKRLPASLDTDQLFIVSAGVAFFFVLAIFPALATMVSLYGLFGDPGELAVQLAALKGVAPEAVIQLLRHQLERLATQGGGTLSFTAVLAFFLTIWFGAGGIKSLFTSMNIVFGAKETRSLLKFNLITLGFNLLLLIGVMALVGATIAVPAIAGSGVFGHDVQWLISVLRWPLLFVVLVFLIAAVYRWGPSRRPPRWKWVLPGSILATLVFIGASALYSWYLANLANYSATYGSLSTVVGFLLWTWISVFIVLAGAELNAEIEQQVGHEHMVRQRRRRKAAQAELILEAKPGQSASDASGKHYFKASDRGGNRPPPSRF